MKALTSDIFSYRKESKCICTEESTLSGNGWTFGTPVVIKSEKTGKVVTFKFYENRYHGRELEARIFLPINQDLRKQGIYLVVFND